MVAMKDISITWWQEVYRKVNNAAVFIDNPSAECLHWKGGVMDMLKAGATSVKEFSSFESGCKKDTKAVIIISSPIIGAVRTVLKDIISNSYFEHCTLIIGCSPSVQTFAQTGTISDPSDEVTVFQKLKQDVLIWMGTKESVVDILCYPIFLVPITVSVFVTPPFRELFPLFKEDIAEQGFLVSHKGSELEGISPSIQISVFNLVSSLHSLLTQLDMREDIYSIGHLSGVVASMLLTHSQSVIRRKRASDKVSVILIDRTLDFGCASSYSSESLFDRILAVLPHLPGHTNDVSINMSPMCTSKKAIIAPGCLAHEGPVLDWLLRCKQKDVLLNLHRELQSTVDKKSKILPRITPAALDKQLLNIFSGKYDLIRKHCGLIQQTLGVTEAMKSTMNPAVELTMSIEKLLLQTMAADNGTSGAVAQIRKLLKCRHEHGLTVNMLLCILVHLYSIVGSQFTFTPDDEATLQAEITNALYSDRHVEAMDSYFSINADSSVEEIDILGRNIMNRLRAVGSSRSHMNKYKYLLKNKGPLQPLVYNSLVDQLLADLVNPAKPDIPDLVSKTSKTSFGLLLNTAHHPLDNSNVLVFIVGGITAQECQEILNVLEGAGKQVLVGSTRFVSPCDTLHLLFNKNQH